MSSSVDIAPPAPPASASRREYGKAKRRERIVDAACELLREVGAEALQMKMIAARAGLSLSTVYNLFPSKQAIITGIFDVDLAKFEQQVAAAPSADALARIFDALDIASALYRSDPGFYRAILWRPPHPPDNADRLTKALHSPRLLFWRHMVEDAIDAGLLRRTADPRVVSALMGHITGGSVVAWIRGEIGIDALRDRSKLGFAVTFAAFATPAAKSRLRDIIQSLHDTLAKSARERSHDALQRG